MSTLNYSFYAIPAYYILALTPQFYATALIQSTVKSRYDKANPRGQTNQQALQKSSDAATYATYERAKGAHQNAMENLPVFFAAVVAANMAKLDTGVVNNVCGAFLAFRTLHTVFYVSSSSQTLANVRSLAWTGGVGCCLYLMIKAGNVLA